MADASSPQRRAADGTLRDRWRAWWAENGVQVVVFALLGIIVAGEVSDFFNDREQEKRDAHQECVLGNAVEQGGESLRRLRLQAPVIEAAGDLFTATTPEERRQVEAELREALREREADTTPVGQLPAPDDCE